MRRAHGAIAPAARAAAPGARRRHRSPCRGRCRAPFPQCRARAPRRGASPACEPPTRSPRSHASSSRQSGARQPRSPVRAPRRPRASAPRLERRARSSGRHAWGRGHRRRDRRRVSIPSRKAVSRSAGSSPTIVMRDRLEAEAQRLLREERAVEVSPLAAYELAARDDDGDAGTTQEARGRVS